MSNEPVIKPIYQQIAIDLANRISKGEFSIDEKIYGRSTLAGQYNVSPETIRRAMILLEDMKIVEVQKGRGIMVKSKDEAFNFIEKFKNVDSMSSIKNDLKNLLLEKKKMDADFVSCIEKLIDYSERFKNTNPFAPLEIQIVENSKIVGKTISEVDFWQNTGATIIGIRRNGSLILSPGPYAIFCVGDVFIMIGEESAYKRVKEFLGQ